MSDPNPWPSPDPDPVKVPLRKIVLRAAGVLRRHIFG